MAASGCASGEQRGSGQGRRPTAWSRHLHMPDPSTKILLFPAVFPPPAATDPWGRHARCRRKGRTSQLLWQTRQPDEPWCSSLRVTCRCIAGRFFKSPSPVRVNFDTGTVQRQDGNVDLYVLHMLQKDKHFVQHTAFSPTVPSRIDCVPIAKMWRQPPPLTALFHYIQNRVQHCQVVNAHVSALARQAVSDFFVLLG